MRVEDAPVAAELIGDARRREAMGARLAERVLTRFYRAMDANDTDAMIDIWHPDPLWVRRGKALRDRRDFRAGQDAKSPTLVARHLIHNVLATTTKPEEVGFVAVVTAIRSDSQAPPAKTPQAYYASHHQVEGAIRLTEDGWRLRYYRPDTYLDVGVPTPPHPVANRQGENLASGAQVRTP